MAGDLSDTGEALASAWMFSTSDVTRPNQWWLALFSTAPGDTGGGTELTQSGYARQAITFNATGLSNSVAVIVGPAGETWPTVTHVGIFDQLNRFLGWKILPTSQTAELGQSLTFAVGDIAGAFD